MNTGELLGRLQGVRSTRDGWTARCPAHEDKSPSLSIREESSKVLVHCFAGCSVEAICSALEINVRNLFTEHRSARRPVPPLVRDAESQISSLRSLDNQAKCTNKDLQAPEWIGNILLAATI